MKNFQKLFQISLLLLLILVTASCEKEQLSDICLIENEVKAFINDKGITKCSVYIATGDQIQTVLDNEDFTISNGFVKIRTNSSGVFTYYNYNLLYLSNYSYYSQKIEFTFIR